MTKTSFTVAMWIKRYAVDEGQVFGSTSLLTLGIIISNKARISFIWNTANTVNEAASSNDAVKHHTWTHIAVSLNKQTREMKIYVSGETIATEYLSDPPEDRIPDSYLYIGSKEYAKYFKGYMEDLFIISEAVTESEVKAIMNWIDQGNYIL